MRGTRAAIAVVALTLVGAACSSSSKSSSPDATGTTTTTLPADKPVFAKPGPYKVGYTTLHLPDRAVAVWYPVDPKSVTTQKKVTYDQRAPLPDNLKPLVPDEFNSVTTMDAYQDLPGSDKGPFPVLLFAHGLSAYRMVNSGILDGVASWGVVVVSVDYTERGIATQVTGGAKTDPALDQKLMFASLDLVEKESNTPGSVLEGTVDPTKVVSGGHSLGGQTAFNALTDPRVSAAIGWAPVSPSKKTPAKPTMIIGAALDNALTPANLKELYATLPPPKRRIEVANAGHNTFTDSCVVIRGGGGLLEFARQQKLVPDALLELGINGCKKENIDPEQFFEIVQHFTVAELRYALGIDKTPVGLGDGIVNAWPGVTMTYEHQP